MNRFLNLLKKNVNIMFIKDIYFLLLSEDVCNLDEG